MLVILISFDSVLSWAVARSRRLYVARLCFPLNTSWVMPRVNANLVVQEKILVGSDTPAWIPHPTCAQLEAHQYSSCHLSDLEKKTRTSWDRLQELEGQLQGRELQGGSRGDFNMTTSLLMLGRVTIKLLGLNGYSKLLGVQLGHLSFILSSILLQ